MYILASAANVQSVLSGKPVSAQHSPGQSGGAGDMTVVLVDSPSLII